MLCSRQEWSEPAGRGMCMHIGYESVSKQAWGRWPYRGHGTDMGRQHGTRVSVTLEITEQQTLFLDRTVRVRKWSKLQEGGRSGCRVGFAPALLMTLREPHPP